MKQMREKIDGSDCSVCSVVEEKVGKGHYTHTLSNWEQLELTCTKWLCQTYGNYFQHQGASDSTVSDILYSHGNKHFYIEVKSPVAQSGQFVVTPDVANKKFVYSKKNKKPLTSLSLKILSEMEKDFNSFASAGTKGKPIQLSQSLMADWITTAYKKKDVKFFITKKESIDPILIPIDKFADYFDITATYRIKRSGSRSVASNKIKPILNSLNNPYQIINDLISFENSIDNQKFSFNDNDYFLSPQEKNLYRLRQLSKTNNANVIFSIKLKRDQDLEDLTLFQQSL